LPQSGVATATIDFPRSAFKRKNIIEEGDHV